MVSGEEPFDFKQFLTLAGGSPWRGLGFSTCSRLAFTGQVLSERLLLFPHFVQLCLVVTAKFSLLLRWNLWVPGQI